MTRKDHHACRAPLKSKLASRKSEEGDNHEEKKRVREGDGAAPNEQERIYILLHHYIEQQQLRRRGFVRRWLMSDGWSRRLPTEPSGFPVLWLGGFPSLSFSLVKLFHRIERDKVQSHAQKKMNRSQPNRREKEGKLSIYNGGGSTK